MSNVPQSDNASKSVRIPLETWASVSHEAVDRQVSVSSLLAIAWQRFMELPAETRERLVRDAALSGRDTRVA